MRIIIKKEVDKEASKIVLDEIKQNPHASLGLAAGSTVIGLYNELVKNKAKINKIFMLDEYYPITHHNKNSFRYFFHTHLISKIKINKINFIDGEAPNALKECERYEQLIGDEGIDLQILGIGSDGHIGFNEPGSNYNSKTRIVNLNEITRLDNSKYFKDKTKVPYKALTMGISTLLNAKKIILLAKGKNKAQAIKDMVEGPIHPGCPASFLRKHPNVILIIDGEAASLLEKTHDITDIRGFHIITKETIPRSKKIVVISPHPDDSSIGPGATIAKLADYNEVHTFVMTTGHRAYIKDANKKDRIFIRETEARCEARHMKTTPHFLKLELYDKRKITKNDAIKFVKYLKQINPEIILIPRKGDAHPTHKLCRKLVLDHVKNVQLWEYEGPWSMFEHNEFNTIVSFNEYYKQVKSRAILCHKSQIVRTRFDIAALALERLRGVLVGEEALFGFGQKSIDLGRNIELFNVIWKS